MELIDRHEMRLQMGRIDRLLLIDLHSYLLVAFNSLKTLLFKGESVNEMIRRVLCFTLCIIIL